MGRALHVNGDHARSQYNFLAHVRMEEREPKALKQNTIAVPSRNLIKQAEFHAEKLTRKCTAWDIAVIAEKTLCEGLDRFQG
ncbi:TPA: hypothetical protein MIV73_01360 [Klebsiella pneumoniae]|nr:hypothetical protein [Klebsiella pneumoniae]HBY5113720.1 hypothetical protein [Klebsiella pneumoniae]